jgi:hypothetical protein
MERPDAFAPESDREDEKSAHQAFVEDALNLATVVASASPFEAGLKVLISELTNNESHPSLSELVNDRISGVSPGSKGKHSVPNAFNLERREQSVTGATYDFFKPIGTHNTNGEPNGSRDDSFRDRMLYRGVFGTPSVYDIELRNRVISEGRRIPAPNFDENSSILKPTDRSMTGFYYDGMFQSRIGLAQRPNSNSEQLQKALLFLNPTAVAIQLSSSLVREALRSNRYGTSDRSDFDGTSLFKFLNQSGR